MSSPGECCENVELFALRSVDTAAGRIPVVPADWSRRDRLGRLKCRLFNSFRMSYTVEPGIYAIGSPDGRSPVLVTANYKLSFDLLRRELAGSAASIYPRLWSTGESSFPSWGHRECAPMRSGNKRSSRADRAADRYAADASPPALDPLSLLRPQGFPSRWTGDGSAHFYGRVRGFAKHLPDRFQSGLLSGGRLLSGPAVHGEHFLHRHLRGQEGAQDRPSTLYRGGSCLEVCPREVFGKNGKTVRIVDRDLCIECGACMMNCSFNAIRVNAGVGCAAAIINGLIKGGEPECGCGGNDASDASCC